MLVGVKIMIDGSKKQCRQLGFELQRSRVPENRSNQFQVNLLSQPQNKGFIISPFFSFLNGIA